MSSPIVPDPPSPALVEALQVQLRSIVDKPLTARSLLELEQTARLSRELLIVGKAPEARRPAAMGVYGSMYSPGLMTSDGLGGYSDVAPYSPSAQSETFGATMVRELVAALPALMKPKETLARESASSLVEAIASAREAKMDDVAEKLKAKLDALLADETTATPPLVLTSQTSSNGAPS